MNSVDRLRAASLFFVRRARQENDHARDERRTQEMLPPSFATSRVSLIALTQSEEKETARSPLS